MKKIYSKQHNENIYMHIQEKSRHELSIICNTESVYIYSILGWHIYNYLENSDYYEYAEIDKNMTAIICKSC